MSEYSLKDERDYEMINGKIYMMSRPNMNHYNESKRIIVYFLSGNSFKLSNVYSYYTEKQMEEMPDDERKAIISRFRPGLFNDLEIDLSEVFEDVE
ncbi:MAG: hypothetical protein FWC47_10240 [Oscillospiraceae bacterium]|nr:hypothetical protein [Oscillospiraceae bacterium]